MKYILIIIVALCTVSFSAFSQKEKDRKLTAYLQTKQFSAPTVGNYVEIHIQFVGYTLNYLPVENGLIGEVAVQMTISQNDSIVNSDAYRLNTPVMVDSIIDDFYDIKRFALNPGNYKVNLQLLDMNSDKDPVKATFMINVEEFSDALAISDVLIAESAYKGGEESPFYKSGYSIIPRISTFYPAELSNLPAYIEIYNMNELSDSVYGLKQYITNAETGEELSNLTIYSRHTPEAVTPIFRQIDLTTVPTGTYTLNYTVIDRNFIELASQSFEFERSNDLESTINMSDIVIDPAFQASITSDSVSYYLLSLIPISKPSQVKLIIAEYKSKNEEKQRKMIQAFWKETSGLKMYDAWIRYKIEVNKVEETYSSNYQKGYETDRGRVYLQYGPPSRTFVRENSPSEYPYEIWEYNKIGVFSNKKFVFYNPDLINNQYRLLHSDMVGELKNPRWSYELAKRNTKNGNVDDPNEYNPDSWGNNSRQMFGQ